MRKASLFWATAAAPVLLELLLLLLLDEEEEAAAPEPLGELRRLLEAPPVACRASSGDVENDDEDDEAVLPLLPLFDISESNAACEVSKRRATFRAMSNARQFLRDDQSIGSKRTSDRVWQSMSTEGESNN